MIFLISDSIGILTVLTQTILMRYEFSGVTMFVSKHKNEILMKLDENCDCVFKIMSSTKITSSEFMKNMYYFHFQMQVSTHGVMCCSDENYFGQCFLIKFPNVATFTLYCKAQPHHALLGHPFHNTAAHT